MGTRAKQNFTVVLVDDNIELARRLESRCRRASVYFRSPSLVSPEWAASLDAVDLVVWDWSKLTSGDHRRIVGEVQSQHPELPMLILDLNLEDEGAQEIVEGHSTDFVRRPVDFEEVIHRVDRLLGSRRAPMSRSRLQRASDTGSSESPGVAPAALEDGHGHASGAARTRTFEHVAFDLHNQDTGRLDAKRVSELFDVPLRRIAGLLRQKPQTVSKTPDARSLQACLQIFERIASALMSLVGSAAGLRIWMNAGNPHLDGKTPLELVLGGHGEVVAELLESMLVGQPG